MARDQNGQRGTKVKTGCATCRIRKVKCDETKPSCQKCVSTGRKCDGYESPFRFNNGRNGNSGTAVGGTRSHGTRVQPIRMRPISANGAPAEEVDIDLLNRYLSTKTIFDVKLECTDEAKKILQASLTDPSVRHAVSSLRALREHLEDSTNIGESAARRTPDNGYEFGIQQYCMALGGLASNLSSPSSDGLKSALLCCQIFISIEQARWNFGVMAQHIIRGLNIMHEYRARPSFIAPNKLVPANHEQLPLLDVFIIKMFIAPCGFAEPSKAGLNGSSSGAVCPLSPESPPEQGTPSHNLRSLKPDTRIELTRLAHSTLEYLDKVSQIQSARDGRRLLPEKASLLKSLQSWLYDLENLSIDLKLSEIEPLSVTFQRQFHRTLKIVLIGSLDSSPEVDGELAAENERLQEIAIKITEGVKAYQSFRAAHGGRGEPSKGR